MLVKKQKVNGVDSVSFSSALQKVYLAGALPEAIMDCNDGLVDAVDVTNSLFVHVRHEVFKIKGLGEVGLGDLSLLCKYLDSVQGVLSVNKSGNRLSFKGGDGGGELQYLCQSTEFISTGVKGMDLSKLFHPCVLQLQLSAEACKQYAMYFNLIKTKSVKFVVDVDDEKVSVVGGLESEHKFTLDLGEYKSVNNAKKNKKPFMVKVYAHHLAAIFGVLFYSEHESPEIMLAPNHPVLIKQNEDIFWALLPLGGDEAKESED